MWEILFFVELPNFFLIATDCVVDSLNIVLWKDADQHAVYAVY